jgi:hypothetical protein
MSPTPQEIFTEWLTNFCFVCGGAFTLAFLLVAAVAVLLVIGSGLEERKLA